MNTERIAHLETLMTTLQHKWGREVLKRLDNTSLQTAAPIATGFVALDDVLCGGIPRQQITEVIGSATSGMTTLALQMLAQRDGGVGVYVDLSGTFDPEYAMVCGIQPEHLLVVQPERLDDLPAILRDLLLGLRSGLVVVNHSAPQNNIPFREVLSHPHLRQLSFHLRQTSCALLWLTSQQSEVSRHAVVRLAVSRKQWVMERGDVIGYQVEVRLTRFQSAPTSGSIRLDIRVDGVVQP